VTDISSRDIIVRLAVAMLIGAILGVNRDLRDKPAGLKTLGLVTVGSAVLTLVSLSFATMAGNVDPTTLARVTQGIITGIGFLGAGVILRREHEENIQGLTTAASIWLSAALGIVCGVGQWRLAATGLAVALILLVVGGPVEQAIHRRWHRAAGEEGPDD
jgi:putative Mg2+ transporter-C (MgtC) family protein